MLEKNEEKWKDKVEIYGVSLDDSVDDVKKRVEARKWHLVKHYLNSSLFYIYLTYLLKMTKILAIMKWMEFRQFISLIKRESLLIMDIQCRLMSKNLLTIFWKKEPKKRLKRKCSQRKNSKK